MLSRASSAFGRSILRARKARPTQVAARGYAMDQRLFERQSRPCPRWCTRLACGVVDEIRELVLQESSCAPRIGWSQRAPPHVARADVLHLRSPVLEIQSANNRSSGP